MVAALNAGLAHAACVVHGVATEARCAPAETSETRLRRLLIPAAETEARCSRRALIGASSPGVTRLATSAQPRKTAGSGNGSAPRVRRRHLRMATRAAAAGGGSDPIRAWLLAEGGASEVRRVSPVFGGCINSAARYDTDAGPFFVKTNSSSSAAAMFEAEFRGLEALHSVGAIRVPRPFKAGALPHRGGFIIMEFIEMGALRSQADLGRQLALLHRDSHSPNGFGFACDNTIGSTPQPNPWSSDWPAFFRDHRLGFQLALLRKQYRDEEVFRAGQKLLEKIPALFEGVTVRPSLLHGDLWSGNIAADAAGQPVILDPAPYYGHSEAEFGMSWCASFGQAFYNAYFEVLPEEPGFQDRVNLYKLYHYLNHYNLFGSSYRGSVMSILNKYI